MSKFKLIAVAAVLACAMTGSVWADLLDLDEGRPDITVTIATIDFDSDTGVLTITARPSTIDYDWLEPPDHKILNGGPGLTRSCEISIRIDNTGALVGGLPGGDDLAIIGLVDADDSNAPSAGESFETLLTGEVTAFGYQASSPYQVFEMVFDVTGGSLAGEFGSRIGLIFNSEGYQSGQEFTGSFAADFTGGGAGYADVFAVPEPTTLLLLLAGGLGGIAMKRRRQA